MKDKQADNPQNEDLMLIGKDISWKEIEGKIYRVTHFSPFASLESGKIKGITGSLPYALLRIESPKLPKEASMPVVHKHDFRNLWEVYRGRSLNLL